MSESALEYSTQHHHTSVSQLIALSWTASQSLVITKGFWICSSRKEHQLIISSILAALYKAFHSRDSLSTLLSTSFTSDLTWLLKSRYLLTRHPLISLKRSDSSHSTFLYVTTSQQQKYNSNLSVPC
jgi:hypothetical protein